MIFKKKVKFPVLAVILFIFAIVWILNDTGIFLINIPWIPVILAVIAVGMILNRYNR
jgi:hypothetical protein